MKGSHLSQYFEAVAAKRLTAVEVDREKSNQHEFNGWKALTKMIGTNDIGETIYFDARFIWMSEINETIIVEERLSWYDSRFNQPARSPEWRLYFPTTQVSRLAQPGDLLFIAKKTDRTLLCIIAKAGSSFENQLQLIFNLPVQAGQSTAYHSFQEDDRQIDYSARFILEELGIEIEESETDYLDSLLKKFNGEFPNTREFSQYARKTLKNIYPLEDPDHALIAWIEQEEKLFKRLERQIVERRLQSGFIAPDKNTDVDGFISFSLSVHGRRKSRAGYALENHLEEIFKLHSINFTRNGKTENKANPDFLFPGELQYQTREFPEILLTMLGVKTTCKDRWRQVLSEAARIKLKHLLTLEPGISEAQTIEMKAQHLQLVVPATIHGTYTSNQRKWLLSVKEFIDLILNKQGVI